ncbi:PQQ-binding-like beta-propeller repeat protein [Natronoglomus mannanivorans]|uniref:PQQ-binding-like beta-propeller repeat protein n=1 Tax=Natronoglomus mannanivorans TaxID=2979990 RepID=A0AAP3E103_9EURY|nr:PQQ-binding-like beta-propeller repeat protein [Halobacteria archaeon AArc-xg1-1]
MRRDQSTEETIAPTTTTSLGDVESAGSRHMWRRSSVHVDGRVFVGRWDGTVSAFAFDSTRGRDALEAVWERSHPERAVSLVTCGGLTSRPEQEPTENSSTLVVGGRGDHGTIVAYDRETGEERWRYETSADLGESTSDRLFELPYVVALETDGESVYAAARRYERDGKDRYWQSVVYAFDPDGTVRWRYATDASPIALSLSSPSPSLSEEGNEEDGEGKDDTSDRVAVGYNRCSGDHDNGLVVLETDTGTPAWTWDPGTAGERRVGDVAFAGARHRLAVASHGDKCGYLLGPGGEEHWRVPLATETEIGDETLYAYPNHAVAIDDVVAFATGNTYALESRETENRHPNEHRLVAFSASKTSSSALESESGSGSGSESESKSEPERDATDERDADATPDELWDVTLDGFAHGLAATIGGVAVPCAQNFRVRDPETHGVRWIDRETGAETTVDLEGIATAVATDGDIFATIEEPVKYHDDGTTRGSYALHVLESF